MKKYIFLILIVLLIGGCSKSIDKMTDELSEKVVEAHQVKKPSYFGLNKEEKELLEYFFDSQKEENKVISIDNSVAFSEESYTEDENTKGIYEIKGKYYIKYQDLKWQKTYDNDDEYAVINLDGKQNALYKSLVPILYEDTKGVSKYNYEFVDTKKNEDTIKYYYKSIYDDSGLVIVYTLRDEKLYKIDTYYQDIQFVD